MNLKDTHAPSVRPGRAHEKVTCALLGELFRGTITPGAKLPTERAMAETFAVNRATVREALRHLEHLDLITIRQGDGAYAKHFLESRNLETAKAMVRTDAGLRREVLAAVLEIRRINSPEIAYAAALKRSPDHLRQLQQAAFPDEEIAMMERDKHVHRIVSRASGNILHVLMTNFCQDFFDDFGHLYFARDANCKRSAKFHRDIFHAIRDQNAGVAREIMRDVLRYAERAVYDALAQETATEPSGGLSLI
jgi:GntR family transcriptional repressor for pyruvate dehydrogenase complex